ncbi:uncharacterized protein TNCV_4103731 [Trichonephila clavipes]|nr:uncharacterized protein TNCV_4103731 [Trichonephila clavipes]
MADKDILEFVQSSKNIIDADSDDELEMNNAVPVPISSEMRNVMKTFSPSRSEIIADISFTHTMSDVSYPKGDKDSSNGPKTRLPLFPIFISDEAHFWLNGYVNKQNCRIWSEANTQVYVETPLHPEKLTVWCALWAGGVTSPYLFKNDEGHNVTVNGDRYRAMITNFFIPELNNHDVQELWFQQDGATCHTARATID